MGSGKVQDKIALNVVHKPGIKPEGYAEIYATKNINNQFIQLLLIPRYRDEAEAC